MGIFQMFFGRKGNTYPLADIHSRNIFSGIVTAFFSIASIPILVLEASANGNFTMDQTILWLFSIYVLGGLYSFFVPLYYRLPVVGAQTLTGIAFLATVTDQFTYNELIGAFIFSGILIIIVGYFGIFAKLVEYIPREIIAAMLAGMITKYMVSFIVAMTDLMLIGMGAFITYFVFLKWLPRIPPLMGAIGVSFVLFLVTEPLVFTNMKTVFIIPTIQVPSLNMLSIMTVSIPLALLILSNDAAVGVGALEQKGYDPPINSFVIYSGLFSVVAGLFGGQSANIAGMMTAICADEESGPKEKRYIGAVVTGIIFVLFGIFAWKFIPFIQSLPESFVSILVGFALLAVFSNSVHTGFSNPKLRISVAITFVIAMSQITIFYISAPMWALLVGTVIANYIEKAD